MKIHTRSYTRYLKNNCGQMLIEALVALSIFLIALTAIVITLVAAVANSRFTQDQNNANKFAQGGIEKVRNLRNTNADLFSDYGPSGARYPMAEDDEIPDINQPALTPNIQGKYRRYVTFYTSNPSCNGTLVSVTVEWNSSRCRSASNRWCHSSEQTTCFTEAGR